MKSLKFVLKTLLPTLVFLSVSIQASAYMLQDSTGLDGDHFSLEAALDLFKEAKSLEAFEKAINDSKNNVNNLDLNEDGEVDYIRVEDHMDGDVHAIVLQAPISEKETQDVAVIEIEKQKKDYAILQIIGNEDLYGEPKIVEPFETETKQSKKGGPNGEVAVARLVVNVWFWPSVRFVYAPGYRVYVSPYRWAYYPRYWRPWRPFGWGIFRSRIVYRPHCRVVTTHRVVRAHRVYTPVRRSSVVVKTRTTKTVAARKTVNTRKVTTTNAAVGKKTTTKVTKTSPAGKTVGKKTTTTVGAKKQGGKTVVGKKTTKTVGKKGPNGKVAGKKTTTKVGAKKQGGKTVVGKKTTTKRGVKTNRGSVRGKKTVTKGRRKH